VCAVAGDRAGQPGNGDDADSRHLNGSFQGTAQAFQASLQGMGCCCCSRSS
jgi:hypothetical protein